MPRVISVHLRHSVLDGDLMYVWRHNQPEHTSVAHSPGVDDAKASHAAATYACRLSLLCLEEWSTAVALRHCQPQAATEVKTWRHGVVAKTSVLRVCRSSRRPSWVDWGGV